LFLAEPSTVLLEFLAWFVWLAGFAVVQNRLCDRFPGMRSACRKAYITTMILPILAGVCLMALSGANADLFAVLNRAFGAGVFAQTCLRSMMLLRSLAMRGEVAIPCPAPYRSAR
jgi:hypothetical protein